MYSMYPIVNKINMKSMKLNVNNANKVFISSNLHRII